MSIHSEMHLSRLREIGWVLWDPIGLANSDGTWDAACADEYDEYMLHAATLLYRGKPAEEAVAYLDWVGSDHMGLGDADDRSHLASVRTVEAIIAYLKTTPAAL